MNTKTIRLVFVSAATFAVINGTPRVVGAAETSGTAISQAADVADGADLNSVFGNISEGLDRDFAQQQQAISQVVLVAHGGEERMGDELYPIIVPESLQGQIGEENFHVVSDIQAALDLAAATPNTAIRISSVSLLYALGQDGAEALQANLEWQPYHVNNLIAAGVVGMNLSGEENNGRAPAIIFDVPDANGMVAPAQFLGGDGITLQGVWFVGQAILLKDVSNFLAVGVSVMDVPAAAVIVDGKSYNIRFIDAVLGQFSLADTPIVGVVVGAEAEGVVMENVRFLSMGGQPQQLEGGRAGGLVCFVDNQGQLVLLNPSFGQYNAQTKTVDPVGLDEVYIVAGGQLASVETYLENQAAQQIPEAPAEIPALPEVEPTSTPDLKGQKDGAPIAPFGGPLKRAGGSSRSR